MSNGRPLQRFRNRAEAGQALARELAARAYPDPVIFALPRGGVPLAAEIASALGAPLDLVLVRKIGVPSDPELAAGAVVNGDSPETVVNADIARHFGLTDQVIADLTKVQLEEIRRRRALYLAGRTPLPVKGRTAIIVDDGIATGATMRAALRALRRKIPARLVLAVPVAARDALESLSPEADETICLLTPDHFQAVGAHYDSFPQVSDEEVARVMAAFPSP